MQKKILTLGLLAVAGLGAVMYYRTKVQSQQTGTSNSISPIFGKISPEQKLKFSLDTHKGGTTGREAKIALAKLDPNKEVSPDGRIWTITDQGKKGYEVAGNYFTTKSEAKQWVRSLA